LTVGFADVAIPVGWYGIRSWIIEASGQQLASEGTAGKEVLSLKQQSLARTQRQAIFSASQQRPAP
jgi:hypothetical protein